MKREQSRVMGSGVMGGARFCRMVWRACGEQVALSRGWKEED